MVDPRIGDYFHCEGDVWTVIHPTWRKIVLAENALGTQRTFKYDEGRWEVCRPSPRLPLG